MSDSLAQRMRDAADTIVEWSKRKEYMYPDKTSWCAEILRREARYVEDEEQEATEHDLMVEELAEDLCEADNEINTDDPYGPIARILIANGWRKDI